MNLHLNSDRLTDELAHLATYTQPDPTTQGTAVTRIVFTPDDLAARAYLKSLATQAGLDYRTDSLGNTFITLPGTDPTLPPIATGSHIDAIPHAGMYDGTVGVLAGLEALRAIQQSGSIPKRNIELIIFTAEEPTRFGIGCLGSRVMSGNLHPDQAGVLPDLLTPDLTSPDQTLAEVRQQAGFTGPLKPLQINHYAAFVELHIEQGPLLERDHQQIGIVHSIAAPASYRFVIEGLGGHAGALLMPDRRDALCAAAELILSIETQAKTLGTRDTVATVGTCEVHPGAVNSVPSRVTLQLDLRDIDPTRRERVMQAIRSSSRLIAHSREVTITETLINADVPATCDPHILDIINTEAAALNLTTRPMVSRAYHDTLFMADLCPVAMIFIPCRAGVSHRPDEFASAPDILRGAHLLAQVLAKLASD